MRKPELHCGHICVLQALIRLYPYQSLGYITTYCIHNLSLQRCVQCVINAIIVRSYSAASHWGCSQNYSTKEDMNDQPRWTPHSTVYRFLPPSAWCLNIWLLNNIHRAILARAFAYVHTRAHEQKYVHAHKHVHRLTRDRAGGGSV